MHSCESRWVQGQSLIQKGDTQAGLEAWNSCLELGEFPEKLVYNYALKLDELGEGVRSLQLIELAKIRHQFSHSLEGLLQWLVENRGFPGQSSPLGFLNVEPQLALEFGVCFLVLSLVLWMRPWKRLWSPNSLSQGVLSLLKLVFSSITFVCGVLWGLNIYQENHENTHPSIIVAENTALYMKEIGPEASIQIVQGQKGRIEYLSELERIQFYWPSQKLKKLPPEQRRRVKVSFISGQSGYLWADQILLVDPNHVRAK